MKQPTLPLAGHVDCAGSAARAGRGLASCNPAFDLLGGSARSAALAGIAAGVDAGHHAMLVEGGVGRQSATLAAAVAKR